MHRSLRCAAAWLLAAALALTACSQPAPAKDSPVTAPVTPNGNYRPPTEPAAPGTDRSADLLPASSLRVQYQIRERSARETAQVREILLREEDRLIAAAEGKVYAVWLIRPDGVWRKDPKGPALLRYLPARLEHGLTWKQTSGEAEVWFQLNREDTIWAVTVLNRGERTTIRFAAGQGPIGAAAENHAKPSASFAKLMESSNAYSPSPQEQRDLLAQAPAGAQEKLAEVVPAAPAEFARAGRSQVLTGGHGLPVLEADLDGDGTPELVRGYLDRWTDELVEFFRADGSSMSYPNFDQKRLRQVRFQGSPRVYFLQESGQPDQPHSITLLALIRDEYNKDGRVEGIYGWEIKSQGTTGNRITLNPEGRIHVEWDMGDAARHTRVREYQLMESEPRPNVRLVETRFLPQGEQLLYPATHADLATAVFFARWFNLIDELPRYFATPEAAAAFAKDGRVGSAEFGPGTVTLGVVQPPASSSEKLNVTAGPLGPDGKVGFAASVYGYEWGNQVWGTISFGTASDGRLIIKTITVEGYRNMG